MSRRDTTILRDLAKQYLDIFAEQIGQDYVLSYRPSPADMVSFGLDQDWIHPMTATFPSPAPLSKRVSM